MRHSTPSRLVVGCLAGFGVLEIAAMLLYPGGTFWDRTTRGVSFWQNYVCDLASSVALNGQPNSLGAHLAQAAMFFMVIGFAPFWWIMPRLFTRFRRLGRWVRAMGLASLTGTAAVALLPSSRFGAWHGVAVIAAATPGLAAASLSVVALSMAETRPRVAAVLGAAVLVLSSLDFALYARTMHGGGPGPILLPIAQKIALLLLLAWMGVVAAKAATVEPPDRHA